MSAAKPAPKRFKPVVKATFPMYIRPKTRPVDELKFFDNTLAANLSTTGAVITGGQLLTIPQGVAQSERIGRKLVVKKIVWNLTFVLNVTGAAATVGCDRMRLMLVQDKQCNGAAATYSTVADGVLSANGVDALRNLDNIGRFNILKNWDIPLNSTAGVSGAWQQYAVCETGSVTCNIPIEYDNSVTTGAITSIRSNNIFILGCCAATNSGVSVLGTVRIRYTD